MARLFIKLNDQKIEAILDNAICPYTINALLRKGTINALIINTSYGILMNVGIISGYEKARDHFMAGEIAFDPRGPWLIVFKTETKYPSKANPIGRLNVNDIEKFAGIKNATLEFVQ